MDYDFYRCLEEGRRLKHEGLQTEEILRCFRANGASIIDSMKLLTKLERVDLGEAKRIVHLSETWADYRVGAEELHARAEEAARELEVEGAEAGKPS